MNSYGVIIESIFEGITLVHIVDVKANDEAQAVRFATDNWVGMILQAEAFPCITYKEKNDLQDLAASLRLDEDDLPF